MELSKDFIESIKNLNELIATQHDQAAAILYRLMFRHEKDLKILDYYADAIFEGIIGFGGEFAEADYRNCIQYLRCINPKEAEWYQKHLDEELKKKGGRCSRRRLEKQTSEQQGIVQFPTAQILFSNH